MAFETKQYLIDLVRQLNLRHMDEPTRAQLADWKKKGVATSNQAAWDPDADLPKVKDQKYGTFAIGELEGVLRWLSETAAAFAADDDLRSENKEVDNFIKKFYDETSPIIPIFKIEEIAGAKEIADYIASNASELEVLFEQAEGLRQSDLEKLAKALRGDYRTNVKAQQTLKSFLYRIEWNVRYNTERQIPIQNFPKAWSTGVWDNEDAKEIDAYFQQNKNWIVSVTGDPQILDSGFSAKQPGDVWVILDELLKVEPDLTKWPKGKIPKAWKLSSGSKKIDKAKFDRYIENLDATQNGRQIDVSRINDARSVLDYSNRHFTGAELQKFAVNIDKVFEEIVSKDKLRDAVTARGGDFAKWISEGLKKSNYKDGDDKVGQKFTDRKRFFGRAESAVKGYLADTWDKLSDKHKRHIYQTKANFVVEGLLKEKVKPTDGLGKVLEKLDGIADKQPVPVQKQIKWMKKTLGAMSNTTQFKEALTHGGQMQNVVNDIIAVVASDSDMENAMMTLETLAVMSSSMTTSGVREELHKMDFTIFSDPSMSFNKGGLGVLTKAIDKTLRFATLAVYEAGNFVANAIKKTGGKIKKDKINAVASGQTVTDDEMRRIQLMAFWNFINSNANTDINIFKRHSEKQKTANAKAELKDDQGNPTEEFKFKIKDRDMVRKNPTAQEVAFLQYMIKQGYAQAA